MSAMEINYANTTFFFNNIALAKRHFIVAFSGTDQQSMKELWRRGFVAYADPENPMTLFGRAKHLAFGLLDGIPLVGIIAAYVDYLLNGATSLPPHLAKEAKKAVEETPVFNAYSFSRSPHTHLTDIGKRPANLLYKALFGGSDPTTQPGSGALFAFSDGAKRARDHLFGFWRSATFSLSAKGESSLVWQNGNAPEKKDLTQYLGENTFNISIEEVQALLKSQRVHLPRFLSNDFYLGLKQALKKDGIVILPGSDRNPLTIQDVLDAEYPEPTTYQKLFGINPSPENKALYFTQQFFKTDPRAKDHTFARQGQFNSLSLYQLGAFVVKSEDYYCLVENGYGLAQREVGDRDALRLISISGIRGFATHDDHELDRMIMKSAFSSALASTGRRGYVVLPAVGMGVWGGDPDVYWRSFFDAVVDHADEIPSLSIPATK
jgi:hypothetical protein